MSRSARASEARPDAGGWRGRLHEVIFEAETPAGQAMAALVMITGYGIIAVPSGIVTVEIAQAARKVVSTQACPECGSEGHDADAVYCKYCAAKL
ncbi:MAG TPA: hypothetical protein VGX48_10665 [Pyrinomonadaceae bacterium]|jgi:voltage-gated potassium channel|nr:hypothetical protein [Pyrinomonadaceae bacterium]